ncbi:MAG: hypothetical protein EAX86_08495 [Candidatus Heimdallarchaeota archaeon]|nr:hypothetical protein [Candidatus Heimdallarchaeota archaeon]
MIKLFLILKVGIIPRKSLMDLARLVDKLLTDSNETSMKFKRLYSFTNLWNQIIDVTGGPSSIMFDYLDKLNRKFNNPFLIGYNTQTRLINLKYFGDFKDLIFFFENSKKFPTETIESWLNYRGKLRGENLFITFDMLDPRSYKVAKFHIYNCKTYSFNKKGLSPSSFKPGGNRRIIFDTLMNKVSLHHQDKAIKLSLVQGIKKSLNITHPVNIQILMVYKLKFEEKRIDDLFEYLFWRFYNTKKYEWKTQWNKGKNPRLRKLYEYYCSKNLKFIESDYNDSSLLNSHFQIFLNDQSTKVDLIRKLLTSYRNIKFTGSNFIKFYREFQKIQHSELIPLPTLFSFEDIREISINKKIGNITTNNILFPLESNKEGITRAIAVIFQDQRIRSEMNDLTKKKNHLNLLNMPLKVIADDKWGRVVTNNRNTIDFPDIVIYEEKSKLAREKIQFKVIPFKKTKYIKYRYEELLSDFLKSIGCFDPCTNTGLTSFRVEYLPLGIRYPPLRNVPSKHHTVIFHYWGNISIYFQSFGEIFNATRIGIYNKRIKSKQNLCEYIYQSLNSGKEMLSGRKRLKPCSELINNFASVNKIPEREYILIVLNKAYHSKYDLLK